MADTTRLIAQLEVLRSRLCPYPGDTCDCKYGASLEPYGEQTGCPELRDAIVALREYAERDARILAGLQQLSGELRQIFSGC